MAALGMAPWYSSGNIDLPPKEQWSVREANDSVYLRFGYDLTIYLCRSEDACALAEIATEAARILQELEAVSTSEREAVA